MLETVQVIILVFTILLGIAGFVRPRWYAEFAGLTSTGPRGQSELRAIFGFFIGMGLAPLILEGSVTYDVVGIAYLAAGIARGTSIVRHRVYERTNMLSLAFEVVAGVLLVL